MSVIQMEKFESFQNGLNRTEQVGAAPRTLEGAS